MNKVLAQQLALDYCCTPQEAADRENHFTVFQPLEGRRRFREDSECFLKIAVVNGKVLFTGQEQIIAWCAEKFCDRPGAWFFEAKNMRVINDRLRETGHQIEMAHPFYLSETKSEPVNPGCEIRWYMGEEIEQFRGDKRYENAYSFCAEAPDMVGVAALKEDRILGMAGASRDSAVMWQIGIDVDPSAREGGIGKLLVVLLKNRILDMGLQPFYGTAMSHIASQKVAAGSGFLPAWAELAVSRIS